LTRLGAWSPPSRGVVWLRPRSAVVSQRCNASFPSRTSRVQAPSSLPSSGASALDCAFAGPAATSSPLSAACSIDGRLQVTRGDGRRAPFDARMPAIWPVQRALLTHAGQGGLLLPDAVGFRSHPAGPHSPPNMNAAWVSRPLMLSFCLQWCRTPGLSLLLSQVLTDSCTALGAEGIHHVSLQARSAQAAHCTQLHPPPDPWNATVHSSRSLFLMLSTSSSAD